MTCIAPSTLPSATPKAFLGYLYDASDQRVIKPALDEDSNESHTVYAFASLELRRAAWDTSGNPPVSDYELSEWTEVPYLFAGNVRLGRVVHDDTNVPTIGGAQTHVFLELGDHLGSTNIVIDKETGELVERGTYQAYGGVDSDYRPGRWKGFPEA